MSSASGEWPSFENQPRFGLMSLLEMINCQVSSLCALCSQLMLEQLLRTDHSVLLPNPDDRIDEAERVRIEEWLKIATLVANEFEWEAVHDRVDVLSKRLAGGITNRTLAMELRVLRETIEFGLKWQLVYRYPSDKSRLLLTIKTDWASVIDKFPSSEQDIRAGVDLWCLGHSTASVFHFMRVLEHGLRALAQEVGLSFDVQNWQQIINQIESEVRKIGQTPSSQAKSDQLQFLSEAAKEFMYFKDGWRNYVSHNRSIYDEYQARSALEHVRSFMIVLSSRLREVA